MLCSLNAESRIESHVARKIPVDSWSRVAAAPPSEAPVTCLVIFDLETVPDLAVARRLLKLGPEASDEVVRETIGQRYAREGTAPLDVFLKPPLHRIACIGALFADRQEDGVITVRNLGARHIGEKSEAELVRDFVTALQRDDPILVTFNGGGFDLPVLRYRALAHGIAGPTVFGKGGRDYWYRFGRDHIDLCDVIAGFGASARPNLAEMAALLDIPNKLDGMDGSQVESFVQAGRLDEIAAYCLGDVIVTFRLMLRYATIRGEISAANAAQSEASLDAMIERQAKTWPLLAQMRHQGISQ
jgi:3'-5' exonuclease